MSAGGFSVGERVIYKDRKGVPQDARVEQILTEGHETSFVVSVAGEQVKTVAARLRKPSSAALPKGGKGSASRQVAGEIDEMSMNDLTESERKALEFRISSASFVVRGAKLTKFVAHRRKQHIRHFKVLGTSGKLKWDSGVGKLQRAESMVTPDALKIQKLSSDELSRCFMIVLDSRILLLMSPTVIEKQAWVAGVNAIMLGLSA